MEKSPKSPKSPKFKTSTATYVISAHGTMLTSMLGTPQTKKYHAINIPENVELYTMVDLGKCVADYSTQADFTCNLKKETQKETMKLSLSPAFKFIHEHGKTNKFPELFLTPDHTTPVPGYKGITHCIPEDYRTSASRGHEIIYNIDAKNTKDCVCCSIVSKSTTKPYNCEKNYSSYYKKQLEGYKYDPTSTSINKCGPILMSEAVKIIQAHCNSYYEPTCVIKIYVFACLDEIDLNKVVRYTWLKYEEARKIAFPPSPSSNVCVAFNPHTGRISPKVDRLSSRDKPDSEVCYAKRIPESDKPEPDKYKRLSLEEMLDSLKKLATRPEVSKPTAILKTVETREVDESKINLMNYYYEIFKHKTLTKVNVTNVVESLTDFKAIPLIHPLLSKYRVRYWNRTFDFITYKDAYIEVTSKLYDKFTGTHKQIIEKLESEHRSRDRNKLDAYFAEALNKFHTDGSDDFLTILPSINEINLVGPFITNASEYEVIDTIYRQLKELIKIEKQKLKLGQGRRKKTLRKKYKKRNSRRLKHAKQTNKTTRRYLH